MKKYVYICFFFGFAQVQPDSSSPMEGTLEEALVKDPSQDDPLAVVKGKSENRPWFEIGEARSGPM